MSDSQFNSIVITVFFNLILIPSFYHISHQIFKQHSDEVMQSVEQKNQFKQMFHSLQHGVVLVNHNRIEFMNKLSNSILSYITQKASFLQEANRFPDINDSCADPMDLKIFFLYQNLEDANQSLKPINNQNNMRSSFDSKGNSQQAIFSMKELVGLSVSQLQSMIFTFDKKLASIPMSEYTFNKNNLQIGNGLKRVID